MTIKLTSNPWPGGLTVPWAEYITKHGGLSEAKFAYEPGSRVVFVIAVDWSNVTTACQQLLGTNTWGVGTTGVSALSRIPPAPHPFWPAMRCMEVTSVKGHTWLDKVTFSSGTYSEYRYAIITAVFQKPRWNRTVTDIVLTGQFGGREYERFCSFRSGTSVTTLSRPPGVFVYSSDGQAGVPAPGDPVKESQLMFIRQSSMRVRWHRVPLQGFVDPSTQLPTHLENRVQTINSATFLGQPPQTVRFAGYSMTPVEDTNALLALTDISSGVSLMVDVDLDFEIHRGAPGGNTRGWNTVPYQDGLFHLIEAKEPGLGQVQRIFELTDLNQIFGPLAS